MFRHSRVLFRCLSEGTAFLWIRSKLRMTSQRHPLEFYFENVRIDLLTYYYFKMLLQSEWWCHFKVIVHSKKFYILSSFTHPLVAPKLYDFLSSAEHKKDRLVTKLFWQTLHGQKTLNHSSKFCCFTSGLVNEDRIFIFGSFWVIKFHHGFKSVHITQYLKSTALVVERWFFCLA